jgi:hypothetical protein
MGEEDDALSDPATIPPEPFGRHARMALDDLLESCLGLHPHPHSVAVVIRGLPVPGDVHPLAPGNAPKRVGDPYE